MSLLSLEVTQFRNLQQVHIEPVAGLNLVTGDNAAGKTSLLESLFYLSYGRSFRTGQSRELIKYGEDFFRLVTRLDSAHQVGIQKSTREQQIRINQQTVHRVADLSALIPIIALHPDSHFLISAGPEHRRQFLDWGVFHVEHQFIQVWKDFRKALGQRNAALRQGEPDRICQLWDAPLVDNALKIERSRLDYLQALQGLVEKNSQVLFPDHRIRLEYRRGWPEADHYQDYLQAQLSRDRDKGYTQAGPHRADIKIRLDDRSAHATASRGQQKILVALLKLSQLELFMQTSDKTCVLLYDDLPAELDAENRTLVMDRLGTMNVQLFVSAIDPNQLDMTGFDRARMFHVEHGEVHSREA